MKFEKTNLKIGLIALILIIVIVIYEESKISELEITVKTLNLKDSLRLRYIDSLNSELSSLKQNYNDCNNENERILKENSKSKLKLSIKDEECEHEKDMLYIELNSNSDSNGELLSKIGQLSSLSDAERLLLSKKSNREPD